jgi:hypothetical protein
MTKPSNQILRDTNLLRPRVDSEGSAPVGNTSDRPMTYLGLANSSRVCGQSTSRSRLAIIVAAHRRQYRYINKAIRSTNPHQVVANGCINAAKCRRNDLQLGFDSSKMDRMVLTQSISIGTHDVNFCPRVRSKQPKPKWISFKKNSTCQLTCHFSKPTLHHRRIRKKNRGCEIETSIGRDVGVLGNQGGGRCIDQKRRAN